MLMMKQLKMYRIHSLVLQTLPLRLPLRLPLCPPLRLPLRPPLRLPPLLPPLLPRQHLQQCQYFQQHENLFK